MIIVPYVIPNCDCGQGIIFWYISLATLFSRHWSFPLNLVSSLFCQHLQFEFLSMLTYLVRLWVAQSAVLCSCLQYGYKRFYYMVASHWLHWFILSMWRSWGTAHEGGGCDQSIGSTISDAIVCSWLWLTATRSSPLGGFSTLLHVVDNWPHILWW